MERQELTPGVSPETPKRQDPFKRLVFWFRDRYDSFECALDYSLTRTIKGFFSHPSIASFINEVEIQVEEYRATHEQSKLDKWVDGKFDRLMSTSFMAELENECLSAIDRRVDRTSQWAEEHGKKPITY